MTITIDSTVFRRRLAQLAAALPREVFAQVLVEEGRQYVQKVVSFLPPKKLAQGRNAVARDIARIAYVLDARLTRDDALKKLIRRGDKAAIKAFLAQPAKFRPGAVGGKLAGLPVEDFTPELHRRRRDRRGRVRGSARSVVLANSLIRLSGTAAGKTRTSGAYLRTIQQRVGFLKSGYAPAARRLGVTLPAWITRHPQIGQGAVDLDIRAPGGTHELTITNRAGRYPDHARVARAALLSRAAAINTKTRRLLAGKAVNLGFARVG